MWQVKEIDHPYTYLLFFGMDKKVGLAFARRASARAPTLHCVAAASGPCAHCWTLDVDCTRCVSVLCGYRTVFRTRFSGVYQSHFLRPLEDRHGIYTCANRKVLRTAGSCRDMLLHDECPVAALLVSIRASSAVYPSVFA